LNSQEELKEAFEKYNWPRVSQLWICVASAVPHEILVRVTKPYLWSYFESISTAKGTNKFKDAKTLKMVTNAYKSAYFTVSAFICWYLMSKGTFLPWFMGGSFTNNLRNMYINYPLVERIDGLPTYYLVAGGYHVWDTYNHLTHRGSKRNDYFEMCVHHLITLSLVAGGHIMGDINSGLLTVYIFDFSDIAVHYCKAICDTHWKKMTDFFGVHMWFWWAYSRMFCLPYCIYYMLFVYPFEIPGMSGSYEGNLYFFKGSLLSMLVIMSVWWFYLISKMLYNAIFKGVQEDT
jgi:hypothetical protein